MEDFEKKSDDETYTCWRVVPSDWDLPPYYVYSKRKAKKLKGSKLVDKVYGPYEQWAWIRNRGLTPENLEKFKFWAKEAGITQDILSRATKESRRNLVKQWYAEEMQ